MKDMDSYENSNMRPRTNASRQETAKVKERSMKAVCIPRCSLSLESDLSREAVGFFLTHPDHLCTWVQVGMTHHPWVVPSRHHHS